MYSSWLGMSAWTSLLKECRSTLRVAISQGWDILGPTLEAGQRRVQPLGMMWRRVRRGRPPKVRKPRLTDRAMKKNEFVVRLSTCQTRRTCISFLLTVGKGVILLRSPHYIQRLYCGFNPSMVVGPHGTTSKRRIWIDIHWPFGGYALWIKGPSHEVELFGCWAGIGADQTGGRAEATC